MPGKLFTAEHAALVLEHGSKKYRPSNGTEGAMFMDLWCAGCAREAAYQRGEAEACPIMGNSLGFDVDDPNYPKEWTYDAEGQPICTAFDSTDKPDPNEHLQAALPLDGV